MSVHGFLRSGVALALLSAYLACASPFPVGDGSMGRSRNDLSHLPARLGISSSDRSQYIDQTPSTSQSAFHQAPNDPMKDFWDFRLEDQAPSILFKGDGDDTCSSDGNDGGCLHGGLSSYSYLDANELEGETNDLQGDLNVDEEEAEDAEAGIPSAWPDTTLSLQDRIKIMERLCKALRIRMRSVTRLLKNAYRHEDGELLLSNNRREVKQAAQELKKRAAIPRPNARTARGPRRKKKEWTYTGSQPSLLESSSVRLSNGQIERLGQEVAKEEQENEGEDVGSINMYRDQTPSDTSFSQLPLSQEAILHIRQLISEHLPSKITNLSKAELHRRIDKVVQEPGVAPRILMGDDKFTEEVARQIGPKRYRQYFWQRRLPTPRVEEVYKIVLDRLKQEQIPPKIRSIAIRRIGAFLSLETARLILERDEETLRSTFTMITAGPQKDSDEEEEGEEEA